MREVIVVFYSLAVAPQFPCHRGQHNVSRPVGPTHAISVIARRAVANLALRGCR